MNILKSQNNYFLIILLFFLSCNIKNYEKEDKIKPLNPLFKEIVIDNQVWMEENLNITKFRNGDTIMEVKSEQEWIELTLQGIPVWSHYNNDEKNEKIYGKLYNWYVFIDERGLGPEGWDIPNEEDYEKLLMFNSNNFKSRKYWFNSKTINGNGDNKSGFNGKPGGFRNENGFFYLITRVGQWWVKPSIDSLQTKYMMLNNLRDDVTINTDGKLSGRSIRLIKK